MKLKKNLKKFKTTEEKIVSSTQYGDISTFCLLGYFYVLAHFSTKLCMKICYNFCAKLF